MRLAAELATPGSGGGASGTVPTFWLVQILLCICAFNLKLTNQCQNFQCLIFSIDIATILCFFGLELTLTVLSCCCSANAQIRGVVYRFIKETRWHLAVLLVSVKSVYVRSCLSLTLVLCLVEMQNCTGGGLNRAWALHLFGVGVPMPFQAAPQIFSRHEKIFTGIEMNDMQSFSA